MTRLPQIANPTRDKAERLIAENMEHPALKKFLAYLKALEKSTKTGVN